MITLAMMAEKARDLGARKGESASEFRARDPQAADALAAWIKENKEGIVAAVVDRLAAQVTRGARK